MPQRGCFITLEGGEGAGKSTLARGLTDRLRERGHQVVQTREPGGTPVGDAIRALLLAPRTDWRLGALSEALMFSAARSEHLDQLIRPALARGAWVICDRFADSTVAYQLASSPDLAERLAVLNELVVGSDRPNLSLMLDLPVGLGSARVGQRGAPSDAFEQRDAAFHQRVHENFLAIAHTEPKRCVVLDAAMPADALLDAALAAIDARLARSSK